MIRFRSAFAVVFLLATSLLLVSCGSEPPHPGNLSVSSEPVGAAITLDGSATGKVTPHTFEGLAGGTSYLVQVELPDYVPSSRQVAVPFGGVGRASFDLASVNGELVVTSQPDGAAIHIDGSDTGEETPHTFMLLAGEHVVTALLTGYNTFPAEITVDVPNGGQAEAEFVLSQQSGELTVTSTPPDAVILLNGEDTGELTPHTFNLPPGTYTVTVELAGHEVSPTEREVTVTDGGTETADFTLTLVQLDRITLFEGFSNVHCSGCPEFNADVEFLLAQPGNTPDRVLYIKWAGPIPTQLDPFYLAARNVIDARMTFYNPAGAVNHPSLFVDGALAGAEGTPPPVSAMQNLIDQSGQAAIDFAIDVAADDLTGLEVSAVATLVVPSTADLSGHTLNVVLTYIEVETPDEYQGVDTYHNVVRDHVIASVDLGSRTAGRHDFSVVLNDADPETQVLGPLTVHGKAVVAFVQRNSDRLVLQAGSTLAAPPGPAQVGSAWTSRLETRSGASLGVPR